LPPGFGFNSVTAPIKLKMPQMMPIIRAKIQIIAMARSLGENLE